MSDKSVPGNRQEVSELVDRIESMSLQDAGHEQDKKKYGDHIRNQREELSRSLPVQTHL